jgi:hypothetical protein
MAGNRVQHKTQRRAGPVGFIDITEFFDDGEQQIETTDNQ